MVVDHEITMQQGVIAALRCLCDMRELKLCLKAIEEYHQLLVCSRIVKLARMGCGTEPKPIVAFLAPLCARLFF